MYGCILSTGKTGQCSDIAPDKREAEPGAGLLGNVTCTLRGLETLGGHKDWFGRSWEGLLGRPWPKRPHRVISARQITDWCEVPAYLLSVRGRLVNFSAGSQSAVAR